MTSCSFLHELVDLYKSGLVGPLNFPNDIIWWFHFNCFGTA